MNFPPKLAPYFDFISEKDQQHIDRTIIDFKSTKDIDILKTSYHAIAIQRKINKAWIRKKLETQEILNHLISNQEQPSKDTLEILKNAYQVKTLKVSDDFQQIEGLAPFNYNHPTDNDWWIWIPKIGSETCFECHGEKYVTCKESDCRGKHNWSCSDCNGSGEVDCSNCGGSREVDCGGCGGSGTDTEYVDGEYETVDCDDCNGSGEEDCNDCDFRGKETCSDCSGRGDFTCSTCYGDTKRYGKIDCPTCHAQGELLYFEYIESEVNTIEEQPFLVYHNHEIISIHKNLLRQVSEQYKEEPLSDAIQTYLRTNENTESQYDHPHLTAVHHHFKNEKQFVSQESYPLLIEENIAHIPFHFVIMDYDYIVSIQDDHQLMVRKLDDQCEVYFDTQFEDKEYSRNSSVNAFFKRTFANKKQLELDNQLKTIVCLAYISKSDGLIDYTEKKYLATLLSPLYSKVTRKEQRYVNDMLGYEKPSILKKRYTRFSERAVIPDIQQALIKFAEETQQTTDLEFDSRLDYVLNQIEINTLAKKRIRLITIGWVLFFIAQFFLMVYLLELFLS